jgi:hypothetical protein
MEYNPKKSAQLLMEFLMTNFNLTEGQSAHILQTITEEIIDCTPDDYDKCILWIMNFRQSVKSKSYINEQ